MMMMGEIIQNKNVLFVVPTQQWDDAKQLIGIIIMPPVIVYPYLK